MGVTRVVSRGMADFQAERLAVPAFTAMPNLPAAWAGQVPELGQVRASLRSSLKVLTIRDDCTLIVPADSDIPVERCASITTTLADLHTTCEHKFNNLIDLLERHCVLKMIK